uniref:Uncharacterized protein n=1 Tax=Arundo donax TaxID=35708 RepID=A0A0A8ZHW8_ARUDO
MITRALYLLNKSFSCLSPNKTASFFVSFRRSFFPFFPSFDWELLLHPSEISSLGCSPSAPRG